MSDNNKHQHKHQHQYYHHYLIDTIIQHQHRQRRKLKSFSAKMDRSKVQSKKCSQAIMIGVAIILSILLISLGNLRGSDALRLQQQVSPQQQQPSKSSMIYAGTSSGLLMGTEYNGTTTGTSIYKFLSVPYAQAPIGELRFMAPVEKSENYSRELDAREFGPTCPQFRHLTRFISPLMNIDQEHKISEDCLHLNIYLPADKLNTQRDSTGRRIVVKGDNSGSPLPVIVWIPGEGFDFADARQFDGSQLAAKTKAAVIIVQYRVGVLGFLNSPLLNITGNMGIHDQIMALRWIKKNAGSFGADPDNITLMGRFTGSMSISSMITAPKQDIIRDQADGKLLFKRVALLSGITVDLWTIDSHQHERAKSLYESAEEQGLCRGSGLDCLRSLSVDNLVRLADYAWRPSVDNALIGSVMPAEAIRMNQFPADLDAILIGETSSEGTLCLIRHMLTPDNNNYANVIEQNRMTASDFHDIMRDDSQFYFNYNQEKSNPIQRAIEGIAAEALALGHKHGQKVSENSVIPDETELGRHLASIFREKYIEACSSFLVKFHNDEFKRNLIAKNKQAETRLNIKVKPVKIYHYELKYKPNFSLAPEYIKTAAHGDDISLIFGLVYNLPNEERNPIDLLMTRRMMLYIQDFVHGNEPQIDLATMVHTTSKNDNNNINNQHSSSEVANRRSWSSEGQLMVMDHTRAIGEKSSTETISLTNDKSPIGSARFHLMIESNAIQSGQAKADPLKLIILDKKMLSSSKRINEEPDSIIDDHVTSNLTTRGTIKTTTTTTTEEGDDLDGWQKLRLSAQNPSQSYIELQQQKSASNKNNNWPNLDLTKLPNGAIQTYEEGDRSSFASRKRLVAPTSSLDTQSTSMAVVLMSVSIVMLLAICLSLGVALFKIIDKPLSGKRTKHHHKLAENGLDESPCNLCNTPKEDSSIERVLADSGRKEDRGFSNVFAKLSSNNNDRHKNQDGTRTIMTLESHCSSASSGCDRGGLDNMTNHVQERVFETTFDDNASR